MSIDDYDAVIDLWKRCEGVRLRDADSRNGVRQYLDRNPGLSFVAEDSGRISGTIIAGHDGIRFWPSLGWVERSDIKLYSYINSDNTNV